MSDRDALAAIIGAEVDRQIQVHASYISHFDEHELADALLAAGVRMPPPEIADPAELDKLPGRSIVVGTRGTHGGLAYQLTSWDGFTNAPNWASAYDTEDRSSSRQVIKREGSVIALYVPTPEVRP